MSEQFSFRIVTPEKIFLEGTAEIIAERFTQRGMIALGEHGKVTPSDVIEIVKMSY